MSVEPEMVDEHGGQARLAGIEDRNRLGHVGGHLAEVEQGAAQFGGHDAPVTA